MATAKNFEDLEVWQESCEFVKEIYRISTTTRFDRELSSQIRRASISIPSNIAEGFERSSNNEFSHFLSIAKGSVGEVRSQLYLARSLDYITTIEFDRLKLKAIQISSMISSLMNYLRKYKNNKIVQSSTL